MGTVTLIKYIIKEEFCGTKAIDELFADIVLSEMKENLWTLEEKSGTIKLPTILNQVVPKERS